MYIFESISKDFSKNFCTQFHCHLIILTIVLHSIPWSFYPLACIGLYKTSQNLTYSMLRKPRSITIRSRWSNPILMLYIIIGRCNAKKNLGTSLPHAHDDDHLHSASRVVKRKRPLVPWLKGFSRWLPSRWALNGKHELFPTHTRGFVFCTNLWRLKKTRLCIYLCI